MNYWLMKTEPETFSIDDLKKRKIEFWDGVRNYQVRNYMRDLFKIGDLAFIYHSNAKPPGIAGIGKVVSLAKPDPTALNPKSPYYFKKATVENNPWVGVDVAFVEKFPRIISLDELKKIKGLEEMLVIRRGQRTSIQPVTASEWKIILKVAKS